MVFQKSRLSKNKIFRCACGYRLVVAEKEYEAITGRCFICGKGKKDCCARDHRFIGIIPAGLGL
jgi:hypothetical protein